MGGIILFLFILVIVLLYAIWGITNGLGIGMDYKKEKEPSSSDDSQHLP